MSDFFKFGKFGKEVSFEQFVSKLNTSEFKNNKNLQKLISLFDVDGNGVIDTESADGQKSEARSLFDRLREAAMSNKNIELEESELETFIRQAGITKGVKSIQKSLSAFFESISTDSVENIETYAANSQEFTPEEIKEITVTFISDDVKTAKTVFGNQIKQQGSVSDFVDDLKETFNTDSAGFKINQFISEEELCANLLQQAQEGTLTQRKYLEQKLKLAESLLIKDIDTTSLGSLSKVLGSISSLITGNDPLYISHYNSMKGAQREQAIKVQLLRDALKNLKPDELNSTLIKAAAGAKAGNAAKVLEEVAQKYLSNFKIDTLVQESTEQVLVGYSNPITGKFTPIKEGSLNTNIENDSIPVYESRPVRRESVKIEQTNPVHQTGSVADEMQTKGERLKTFEETFRDERGVEYDSQKIMDYTQKNAKAQFLIGMNNKKQEIYNILYENTALMNGNNRHGADEQTMIISKTRLENSLVTALINLYGKDAQKIQKVINSLIGNNTIKVLTNEKGEFESLDYGLSPSIKSNLIVDLSNKLQNMLESNYQKALSGKSLEDYISEAGEAYKQAYGDTNSRLLAEGYVESQQEGVQTVKSAVQTGGMVVMIAGQAFPVLGQAVATAGLVISTLGGTAVDALENYTKEGGPTEQDKQDMLKELGISIALVSSGFKSAQMSESVFRTLVMRNCPKLLAFASEVGIDATMSLVADYAITGQIDLDGEGLSQLQAILTGLIRAKGNFKTYINTHAGDVRTPQTTRQKPTFGLDDNINKNNLVKVFGSKKEAEVIVSKIVNDNPNIKEVDFKNYIQSVNFDKIYEVAPQIKNYTAEQKALFLKMHYLRGTKDFSKDLTLPDNLTDLLSKQPIIGKDLDDLLTVFPLTEKRLGVLPPGLNVTENKDKVVTVLDDFVKTILKQEIDIQDMKIDKLQALDKLHLSIEEWAVKSKEIYDEIDMHRNETASQFAKNLSDTTGKNIEMKYIGGGTAKIVFKISIEGSDPVVINVFHNTTPKAGKDDSSGLWYEVPIAPFLNKHSGGESDNFAHFFYGKYAQDGYSIVQYIDGEGKNNNLNENTGGYAVRCGDNNAGNQKGGVVVDFGKMGIKRIDGTKPWSLEGYVVENKNETPSMFYSIQSNNTFTPENGGFVSDTWNALKKIVFPKQAELEKARADLKELTLVNPGEKVSRKITTEWILEGIDNNGKSIPYKNAENHSNEVSNLIFQGKLSEHMTERYETAKKHLQNVIRTHLDEIQKLAKENKNDIEKFTQGFLHILAKEVGLENYEPKIIIDKNASSSAIASWSKGTIRINPRDLNDAASVVQMIPHEFMHILQFRDFIAEYGEDGIRQMVDEHNGIAPENKDNVFNDIINEEYVQQLLKSVEEKKTQYGSIDHYLNKIYLSDATKGVAEYKDGAELYKQKRVEQEAYYIGNSAYEGLDEWNTKIKYKK